MAGISLDVISVIEGKGDNCGGVGMSMSDPKATFRDRTWLGDMARRLDVRPQGPDTETITSHSEPLGATPVTADTCIPAGKAEEPRNG